jgi:hypothetical protein
MLSRLPTWHHACACRQPLLRRQRSPLLWIRQRHLPTRHIGVLMTQRLRFRPGVDLGTGGLKVCPFQRESFFLPARFYGAPVRNPTRYLLYEKTFLGPRGSYLETDVSIRKDERREE